MTAAYTRAAGLTGAWHFLTGALPDVRAVWFDHGVGVDIEKPVKGEPQVAAEGAAEDAEPSHGLSAQETDQARQMADAFGGGYE